MDPLPETQLEELMSHSAWLRGLAGTLVGDPAAADDLVQETWLAAIRKPPDRERPSKPWLAGVMRKLVALRARGESRRVWRQQVAAKPEGLPSTAAMVEEVDTQRRVARAVLTLSEPYRTTVLLRYYRGLSAAEIARRQGLPSGTVRWRLKRGLEDLRVGLDAEWPDRRSWCLALLPFAHAQVVELATPAAASPGGLANVSTVPWVATLTGLKWGVATLALGTVGWFGLERFGSTPASDADPTPIESHASSAHGVAQGTALPPASQDLRVAVGRPAATSRPASAGGPATRTLRLLQPDGRPACGLLAAVQTDAGALLEGTTDGDGVVLLPGVLSPASTLYVKRPDSFLERTGLAFHWPVEDSQSEDGGQVPGELVIRLAAGVELSGHLRVAGHAPRAPIALTLTRDQPLFGEQDAPEAIRETFRSARIAHCRTAADGAFRFVGLAPDWQGTLRLPPGVRFAGNDGDGGRSLALTGPSTGLKIELAASAQLFGRVVVAEGEPALAEVECVFQTSEAGTRRVALTTDEGGAFRTPIRASYARVWVRARTGEQVALAARELERERDAGLGDLVLQEAVTFVIEVLDPEGEPLPKAEVVAFDGGGHRSCWSEVTGEDGSAQFELPAGLIPEWCVDRFGYRASRRVASGVRRLSVTLAASPTIQVSVLDEGGGPRPLAEVRILGDGPGRAPAAGSLDDGSDAPGDGARVYPCDRAGRLALDDFEGHETLTVEALGPLRNVFASRVVALDGPGDYAVELRTQPGLATFSGSVSEAAGRPVVGAALVVTTARGATCRLRSGREGRFQLLHGETGPVRVEVSKIGFETISVAGLPMASAGERDFVLYRVE